MALEAGTRHFKPQMVGGTLQGIGSLSKSCPCGSRPREPVVGKERSRKSAAYPLAFCKAYGELVAKHFYNVAKAEFLEGRLKILGDRVDLLRAADLMKEAEDLNTR